MVLFAPIGEQLHYSEHRCMKETCFTNPEVLVNSVADSAYLHKQETNECWGKKIIQHPKTGKYRNSAGPKGPGQDSNHCTTVPPQQNIINSINLIVLFTTNRRVNCLLMKSTKRLMKLLFMM